MGKCHFNSEWLHHTDSLGIKISMWCRRENEFLAFCKMCKKTVNVSNGYQALRQHSETTKHKHNVNLNLCPSQLKIKTVLSHCEEATTEVSTKNTSLQLVCVSDNATRAELIWVMKTVAWNLSPLSCDGISNMFQVMFPGTEYALKEFSLSHAKASYYITEALGPYFRKQILFECQTSDYSLEYDETTNSESRKELQIVVRYWSDVHGKIVTKHLETFFIGRATGDILKDNLLTAIKNADLPLARMVALSSDGPNVNKRVWNLMNQELITLRRKGLVNIGTCNIHICHNAFQKGLSELGMSASELVLYLHIFFDDWPSRREDYESIQVLKSVPLHSFIKHIAARWLTLSPASERVLEQWDAVIHYFLVFIPKNQPKLLSSSQYLKIVRLLKLPTIKAELHFVISIATIFMNITKFFQREEPLVHILYDKLRELVILLFGRIMKVSFLNNIKTINEDVLGEETNFLSYKQTKCGDAAAHLLETVSEKDRLDFLLRAQKHVVAACRHIISKTSLSSEFVKRLRFLQPHQLKTTSSPNDITIVSKYLPFEVNLDMLLNEWNLIQLEKDMGCSLQKDETVDNYWKKCFCLKDEAGNNKYPIVTKIVKACLSISHGSSAVERGFSRSGRVLTDDKASMSVKMLNARLNIYDGLKQYNSKPERVPITKELLCLARQSHKSYLNYLEIEKKKKEDEMKKVREEQEALANKEEELKKLKQDKIKIKELEADLKVAKEEQASKQSVADSLLEQANNRLKTALIKKNLIEAEIAQGILESFTKKHTEERVREQATESIRKQIEKRKTGVIENFFNKKKK